jgi:hypothetical protein
MDHRHPEEDIHHCRFSRAIFTYQAKDLSLAQRKGDSREHAVTEEGFSDIFHPQQRLLQRHSLHLDHDEFLDSPSGKG